MPGSNLEQIEEFLRQKGQRVTSRRRLILKEILSIHRHFTADDLYERVRGVKRPPSKATVYRLLALLVEGNFLETHQFGDRFLVYEISMDREHHDHMMCLECGRIVEFSSRELETIQQRILERHGFKMLYHSHKLYGLCQECRQAGKKGPALVGRPDTGPIGRSIIPAGARGASGRKHGFAQLSKKGGRSGRKSGGKKRRASRG